MHLSDLKARTDFSPAHKFLESLRYCVTCPRECGVNRFSEERGFCQSGVDFDIGTICLHRGEEPVISGSKGAVNIFFARCNMQCVFCQNHQISRTKGPILTSRWTLETIVQRIGELLEEGAHMVSFVSPSHFIPQMKAIICALRLENIRPTIVMNTNGYDKVSTLRELEGWVDIYLPDIKYMDDDLARKYSLTPEYPKFAKAALREMYRQKGSALTLDQNGLGRSGLIIRHLVMPSAVENSLACLRFIAEELSTNIHISLMSQYHPTIWVQNHPQLGRTLFSEEYAAVEAEMERLGFQNGWVQPLEAHDHYKPDFDRDHPFAWNEDKEAVNVIKSSLECL